MVHVRIEAPNITLTILSSMAKDWAKMGSVGAFSTHWSILSIEIFDALERCFSSTSRLRLFR